MPPEAPDSIDNIDNMFVEEDLERGVAVPVPLAGDASSSTKGGKHLRWSRITKEVEVKEAKR